MKVFPRRTNQTAVRCMLDGPELEALLTEAAAKAAGLDLSDPNVKVERVQVEAPDYSQHRRTARVIVDLVVIHDASALADWVPDSEPPPKALPPSPPPMRTPNISRLPRWVPYVAFLPGVIGVIGAVYVFLRGAPV